MAVRKTGRSVIEVEGRRFVWSVYREREVRIASEDKKFVVSFHWVGKPTLAVHGPEFPGVASDVERPVWIAPPEFSYRSPAGLARQLIAWVFGLEADQAQFSKKALGQ